MTLEEYKQKRINIQKLLIDKIKNIFIEKEVIAMHQFGSFTRGTSDELSDLDLWFTFKDETIDNIIAERDKIFEKIGKTVIKYEPPQNAPLKGKYSLVIHEIDGDLYHVDYYLSTLSKTNIRTDAILIYGDDSLPRGEWILDNGKTFLNTPPSRIDFLICMSFIGVKYVIRKGKPFLDFLVEQYNNNRKEHFPNLKEIKNSYDLRTIKFILDQHFQFADNKQKNAIQKIKDYLDRIEKYHY